MSPVGGINPSKVSYFSLEEYVSRIKLSSNVLTHLEDTSRDFDQYMKKLRALDDEAILYFLSSSFDKELRDSNLIEGHLITPKDLSREENIFFDRLDIDDKRIKDLHAFVTDDSYDYDYRTIDAWIRKLVGGNETIFWYGANPEDIPRFINDFIKIYNTKSASSIHSNAFIKSALMHLLLVRIHPFKDGNGRTSRMIQDMKFTEVIDRTYDYGLRIAPLHLSTSIFINWQQYYNMLDSIYFDLEHDCNDEINNWFDFILFMYDEQIYFCSNNLNSSQRNLQYFNSNLSSAVNKQLKRTRK